VPKIIKIRTNKTKQKCTVFLAMVSVSNYLQQTICTTYDIFDLFKSVCENNWFGNVNFASYFPGKLL